MQREHHLLLMPPNWIGDVIMAQPAMASIVRAYMSRYDNCRITVCGRSWLKDLIPWLNIADAEYAEEIPAADTAYLFPNSFRSAWQCRKAGVERVIGYRGQWRRLLLSDAMPRRIDTRYEHHRLFHLDLARQSGIEVGDDAVELSPPADAIAHGADLMRCHGIDPERAICIAPGAQFGGAKCYPASGFKAVAESLTASGWQPLILGMHEDSEVAELILRDIKSPSWNAAGATTLTEAIQLIAASQLMLCNDSGLMHLAAGLGIATVVPFGATDPARTSPSGPKVKVIYRPAPCSPCLKRECSVDGHPCMANITPQILTEACTTLLGDD